MVVNTLVYILVNTFSLIVNTMNTFQPYIHTNNHIYALKVVVNSLV